MLDKVQCLGVPISAQISLSKLVVATKVALNRREPLLITFVNPWICSKWREGAKDYQSLFERFDYICCDGVGMVIAARLTVPKANVSRVSFDETSYAEPFFAACAASHREVVLVGGEPGVTETAAAAISKKVPGLIVAATFDGFEGVDDAIRYLVNNPSVAVICGMGVLRQEQFLLRATSAGWAGVGATCGGFLDQVNAARPYYPRWADHLQMRWIYRFWKEPRRLWRRYLIEYWPFALALATAVVRRVLGRGTTVAP